MDTTTEQLWRRRVKEFRASGLTARAFARAGGFHETTFSKYVRRFGAEVEAGREMTLARVEPGTALATIVGRAVGASTPVEIVASRGLVVRVGRGFDEATLRAVLRVLGEEG